MAKPFFIVTGDRRLNDKLRKLAGPEAKKIIRRAARDAVKPVAKEAKKNIRARGKKAPVRSRTGKLRRSITVRSLPKSRVHVGARVTTREGLFHGDTFYGGFLELGWFSGKRGQTGRKYNQPRRFIKQAAASKRRQALAIYKRGIKAAIRRTATIYSPGKG